jgi:ActR/RegA family two-component response regulator
MRILVVTQQEDVRRLVEEVVAGSSDEVLGASDLATGLAVVVEQMPALAIVDIALAGGAALAMIHHVIASSAHTAVYALAAPAAFETAAEALSLGATGLIVAPPTGDAVLRVIAEAHAKYAADERLTKLTTEARDAAELVDVMTQALLVAKAGDARALGETLLTLFLIASGAHGVAVYGEENADGTRKRVAGYGTALELLDRYDDLELTQIAATRHAEVIGLAATSHMYGCVLLERPSPTRTARIHRTIEFATALMPLCTLARTAIAEDTTAPRSRALPLHVFERLVQRDLDSATELAVLCALKYSDSGKDEVDTGPLGPALAIAGAAVGVSEAGEVYVLLPKTSYAAARGLLLDVPLAVGIASAPADGPRAGDMLARARARARRATRAQGARELRNRPLADIIGEIEASKLVGWQSLEPEPGATESVVLHACRHARLVPSAEITVAHGGEAPGLVSAARAGGGTVSVRDVSLTNPALASTHVVLVLTPRASWGLVARKGRLFHTGDPLVLELLRQRVTEAP